MKRTSTLHPQLVPGYRLDGRYELLFPYAQGGMATVWVARVQGKHGFEKLVAVKTILPHFANDESFRKMFLDEARIASRIRHPNVAELDDLGEDGGTLYMVLEWIDGDSWAKLVNAITQSDHELPINIMLRIAADACAGLHTAHELRDENAALLNVVHRDVSPQNILITNSGITKVIDFGIAKARDRLSDETRVGMLKGKLEYAAPEQAMVRPVDWRADVWAVGAILYQVVSGNLPYQEKNDVLTLRVLTSGKPPAPLPAEVPEAVRAVIMRALSPLEARFATAAEMQRALETAMTQPTTQADVALCMRTYLVSRIEARRKDIAAALAEASGRAASDPPAAPAATAQDASGHAAPAPQAPPAPTSGAERRRARMDVDDLTTAAVQGRSPMRAVHWLLMGAATGVTVCVWAMVASLLFSAANSPSSHPESSGASVRR